MLIVRGHEYVWVAGKTFTGPWAWSLAHNYVLGRDWKYVVLPVS